MAQKSGFFNALNTGGVYDRKYNANDYSENLAVIISNGVLRSADDDLKVTANGMILTVAAGRAWIKGHWYRNDASLALSPVSAPVGGNRIDRVVLRLDNNVLERSIEIEYITGTVANTPVAPALTRTDTVFEIALADIYVAANATSLNITDDRSNPDICGWIYSTSGDGSFFTTLEHNFNEWFEGVKDNLSSVTLFKRYSWQNTLNTATSTVQFNIPQYDSNTSFIEVYVNGILETRYTLAGNIITFTGTLVAGTVVTVNAYKSIDGTGIQTIAGEITALQNAVASLEGVQKYTYVCTGLNDNISLSQIAQAFYNGSYDAGNVTAAANAFLSALGGNTYLAALTAEAQITVNVVGRCGITSAYAGSGTTESRYRWFGFGTAGTNTKRIIFDFAKCEKITVPCAAGTNNIIFYGTDLYIKNANVYAYSNGSSTIITMIAGSANTGRMDFEDCRFSVSTSGNGTIAENGTFINCWCKVTSSAGNALCFSPKSASLIRVIGGTFYAYKTASSMVAAIFNTASSETNAVVIAQNINCPTVTLSGFSQQYLSAAYAGQTVINGVCSTMTTAGTATTVTGQIWKSKQ